MRQSGFAPIIFLGLIFLGITIFLVSKPSILKDKAVFTTPTSSPNIPINWNTYVGESFKVSFKYPNEWNLPKENIVENHPEIYFEDKNIKITYLSGDTLDNYVSKNLPTDGIGAIDYTTGKINGKKLFYKSGVNSASVETRIIFPGKTQGIIIVLFMDYPGNIIRPETVDQIISTFEFTQ